MSTCIKSCPSSEKSSAPHSRSHVLKQFLNHTFAFLISTQEKSAVLAKLSYSLRIRYGLQFVHRQVRPMNKPTLSYERELNRQMQVGIY